MFKAVRRIATLATFVFLAIKGFFAFLSWMDISEESKNIWDDEDSDVNEFEEV